MLERAAEKGWEIPLIPYWIDPKAPKENTEPVEDENNP